MLIVQRIKAAISLRAFLVVAAAIGLTSCVTGVRSTPRHPQATPAQLGDVVHVFVSTNAYTDLYALKVTVHRFRGSTEGFWGAEKSVPRTIVGNVTLTINGDPVSIPTRAFRDLSEVLHGPQVGFIDAGMPSFFIRGGTGGFAYTARFEVRGNKLKKRVVNLDDFEYRVETRF
jgi:hypothetical protein